MTIAEAAVRLSVSPDFVRRELVAGRLVGYRYDPRWTVEEPDLDLYHPSTVVLKRPPLDVLQVLCYDPHCG